MIADITPFRRAWPTMTCAALLAACGGGLTEPEEAVRAWMTAMLAAAEAKDRREIIKRISPHYVDARGNSRDDIENLLRAYFLRTNKVALISTVEELRVFDGSAAEVSVTVGMAGTDTSRLGFSADAYRFEIELENDGSDWLLTSARWGQLGEQPR